MGDRIAVMGNGPYRLGASFLDGSVVRRLVAVSHTLSPIFQGKYFFFCNLSAICCMAILWQEMASSHIFCRDLSHSSAAGVLEEGRIWGIPLGS